MRPAGLFLLAFAFFIACCAPVRAGDYEDGVAAFDQGDYATALALLRPLADQGNANAQSILGRMYAEGRGVPHDGIIAARWYRRAAEQGQPFAELVLGEIYFGRQPPDYAEAARWYRRSAEHGVAMAQFSLASMYEKGQGVAVDYQEAAKWYAAAIKSAPADDGRLKGDAITAHSRVVSRLGAASAAESVLPVVERANRPSAKPAAPEPATGDASEPSAGLLEYGIAAYAKGQYATAIRLWRRLAGHGSADAAYNLGWMYETGKGVPQDYREAAAWYRMAATQGDAAAQAKLGAMYKNALGLPRDLVEAYVWFSCSALNSIGKSQSESAGERDEIAAALAPDELDRARRLAAQCQGSDYKECD